jgi:putative copper resistance protein D
VNGPDVALALARFGFYAAAIAIFGTAVFVTLIAPRRLGREISADSRGWIVAAGWLALAATLAWLPLKAAAISGWAAAGDGGMMRVLAFDTAIGQGWLTRLGLSLFLVAALVMRAPAALCLVLAGLVLASLSLAGHASMDEGLRGVLHRANDVVHVQAAGFWLGSLVILPASLARLRSPDTRIEAGVALRRFSTAGHGAVALVVATGLVNTRLTLGHLPLDPTSPYQSLLALKILLVLAMVGAAVVNRYVFTPHLDDAPERAAIQIRTGTLVELVLGGLVLALVAYFGLLDPV